MRVERGLVQFLKKKVLTLTVHLAISCIRPTFFLSWASKTQPNNHWTKRMASTRFTTTYNSRVCEFFYRCK